MNIFRRLLLGSNSEEVESPKAEETGTSSSRSNSLRLIPSEAGSSSMHQPDPGVGTPQSSSSQQRGRTSDGDCVIEILSSDDDERVSVNIRNDDDKDGTETATTTAQVVLTTTNLKPSLAASTTKALSVTATDTSNDFDDDDDGDEGKENATAMPRTCTDKNLSSNAATSKAEPDAYASPSLVKPGNATTTTPNPKPTTSESQSPVESTELKPVATTDTLFSIKKVKRRRKRARDSPAILPSPFSKKNYKSPSINNPSNDENAFAFLSSEGQQRNSNDKHQETTNQKRDIPIENRTLELSKTSSIKRPHHVFSATAGSVASPQHKKRSIQEASVAPQSGEKRIPETPSGKEPTNTEHNTSNEQAQEKPLVESKEAAAVDSPSKAIPQFKLPPELAPFNNPGVCDYGVIRTSRLRNRKKTNVQDDVLYQNIQGQRRCRATRDGKKMTGQGNTNRCLNCAEGVFKYCHTHRNLDEDQRAFWEQRRRRDAQIGSASSSVRTNMATTKVSSIKASLATKAKPPIKARTKGTRKGSTSGLNMKYREVVSTTFDQNDGRRCVVLCPGKGRCSRRILKAQVGFCYGHASMAEKLRTTTKDELFLGHANTLQCTAVSKVGTKCKFKALDNCVFCVKHIHQPPEKAYTIASFALPKVKEETTDSTVNAESTAEPTKGSTKYMGRNKSSTTTGSNIVSTIEMQSSNCNKISKLSGLQRLASNVIGKAKNPRKLFQKSACDSSVAESDEVPKNIEFPRTIEFSKEQIEMATSFDNMCFNVYKSKRCWYKRAEGAILCHKCLDCHEKGTPFDHILNQDGRGDESIIFSSRCVKFENGKQCEKMALKGKILCQDCLQSTKSGLEYSDCSGASQAESSSDEKDSDSSSSSATFSSSSDDSQDSRISDDTNYDSYCKAYSHKEFFDMWKNWEKKTERMDDVEDSRLIKRANNTMSPTDTDGQVKAQYGRVLPHAMKKMIKILELGREDVFLDIGHGVGNTCLHASFCTGCDSRGIEVVSDRHEIADKFRGGMYAEHNCRDEPRPEVGKVDLRLGRLEDPHQKEFLTKGITRAYVNNFNGVFAERSSKNKDKWFLDDYISGIFASMAPGAIMVTFHPLNLGLDRDSSNSLRSKHNLAESDHASYYQMEKILLGKAFCSVKWNKRSGNTNDIYVYKYRRLFQPGHHDAVFLCSNPSCKFATDMIPIPATTLNEDGRCVINHCECRFSPKNLRKRSNNKQTSP